MKFRYETDRLILQVLSAHQAEDVLHFYIQNRDAFEPYEAQRPLDFYTLDFQSRLLLNEQQQFLRSEGVRFYIFLKEDPSEIVGCVHFYYINEAPNHQTCSIGYKIGSKYQRQHLGEEAVTSAMEIINREMHISRIEAHIMPSNVPSILFAEKIGFEAEGLLRKNLRIRGVWEDHFLYSYLFR